jgi:hypothetical protein
MKGSFTRTYRLSAPLIATEFAESAPSLTDRDAARDAHGHS